VLAVAALLGCVSPPEPGEPLPGLKPLVARATAARGLDFPAAVEVRSLPPEAVASRLAEEIDRVAAPAEIAAQSQLAVALGLLPEGADLRTEMLRMQSDSVAGFFTPVDRTLYVVEGDGSLTGTLGFQSVVVHELVHALQAAHSNLPDITLGIADHDDLSFALAAVLEGGATWAMLRDESSQDGLAQRRVGEVASGFDELVAEAEALGTPRWLREAFLRPYALGYALAVERTADDGTAGLDALLASPPLSSRELLHAEAPRAMTWLPVDPRGVAPDVACRKTAANTYGEVGLRVALEEAGLAEAAASSGADGWVADRALGLDCPDGFAVVWLLQLEDEDEAGELASLIAELASSKQLRVEQSGNRVLLSAGLEPSGRERLLALEAEQHADLAAYLEARPDILARVRSLRRPRFRILGPLRIPWF
jgi:hypothetical protein